MGWTVLRLALAGLLGAHGWARLLLGGVVPFGGWLTSQGGAGRNGVEYSALIVVALMCVGAQHAPSRSGAAGAGRSPEARP